MRVLLLTKTFPVVSETFISLHAQALIERGCHVGVLAAPGDPAVMDQLTENGLPVRDLLIPSARFTGGIAGKLRPLLHQLGRSGGLALLSAAAVDRQKGRTDTNATLSLRYAQALELAPEFDVVHAHFGSNAQAAAQLKSSGRLNLPLVVTFHGTDLNKKRAQPNQVRYARVLQQADMITVGTPHMAEHFAEAQPSIKRLECVPMGIDVRQFPFRTPNPHPQPVRLVSLGRLVEFKGTEYAVRAMEQVLQHRQDIVLDIIGDGPLRPSLENLISELGVGENVRLLGALPHPQAMTVMRESDIFVHPGVVAKDGTREGQGVVLAEAQATGLPVIAARAGGIPYAVSAGKSAIMVEPRDSEALAEAILQVAANSTQRLAMATAGRELVEQQFDQDKLMDRWIDLYHQVVKSNRQ